MSERSGSLQSLRRTNQERLFSLLLNRGPTHRAELARLAGVSRTTVSTIISELLERNLVIETEPPAGKRLDGRAREVLTINPAAGAAAGLDFTLRNIDVFITDLAGQPLGNAGATIQADASWTDRAAAALALLDNLLDEARLSRPDLIGVGVGVPGQIASATGTVGPSLPGQAWVGVNVPHEFGQRLNVPVLVENNTRLESVAEIMHGAGRGAQNLFYFGLSSGIGTGMFFNGELYRGAVGGAGELGHMSVDIDGPACPCGNRGCLIQYAAVPAILETLRPRFGAEVTIEEILDAADAGDRACAGVLSDAGQLVGRVLANICNLLNPERIVVGGELARAGDILLNPMRTSLQRYAMALSREVELVPAQLEHGSRAGALGGAALVLRETPGLASILLRGAALT